MILQDIQTGLEIEKPHDLVKAYQKRAKKRFGQHFLSDPSILENIVDEAKICDEDHILEIGPGCGTLTWQLLKSDGLKVHAVEIDKHAARFLRQTFSEYTKQGKFQLIEGDALKFKLRELLENYEGAPWVCVANLPYNVGTHIFFRLTKYSPFFKRIVLMFQLEVAKRMVAKAGMREYGSLSLYTHLHYEARLALTLKPGAFFPPPKVHSAVVILKPVKNTRIEDEKVRALFEKIVRTSFQMRRKKMTTSLKSIGFTHQQLVEALTQADIDKDVRPEVVDFEQFKRFAEALS